MSNEKTQKNWKDECIERGIVPGARIKCAFGGTEATVGPTDDWMVHSMGAISVADYPDNDGGRVLAYSASKDSWATVIAPPTEQPDALLQCDACLCGPEMREAIVAMAKGIGIYCNMAYPHNVGYSEDKRIIGACQYSSWNFIPVHEFIRRLSNTKPGKKQLDLETAKMLLRNVAAGHDVAEAIGQYDLL